MEQLKNGIEARYYYKLLEWKDKNLTSFIRYAEFLDSIRTPGGTVKKAYSLGDLSQKHLEVLYRFVFSDNIEK